MQLKDKRVLLTGATGNLGVALAIELAKAGAKLGLVDTHYHQLGLLYERLSNITDVTTCYADITERHAQQNIVHDMYSAYGGTDILINNAGIKEFIEYTEQKPAMLERVLKVNVIAPMQLARLLLPDMLCRESGHIVNIGSPFGSIASPYFTAYSASKFALRGFSEALRRELDDTRINVTYISPKGIDTSTNPSAMSKVAKAANLQTDVPAYVAAKIIRAIKKNKKEVYMGAKQNFLKRLNGVVPLFMDVLSAKRNRVMRQYTHQP